MYLIDHDRLVKQLIPPHWRNTWKESIIRSLIEPLVKDYEAFYDYIFTIPQLVNLNSQVMVMEQNLNRIAGHQTRLIFIDDGPTNMVFIVNMPSGEPAKNKIIEFVETYKIGGSNYEINEY